MLRALWCNFLNFGQFLEHVSSASMIRAIQMYAFGEPRRTIFCVIRHPRGMNEEMGLQVGESRSEFWARHIALWKDGSLNIREYCEAEELSRTAFGYWRPKLSSPKVRGTEGISRSA